MALGMPNTKLSAVAGMLAANPGMGIKMMSAKRSDNHSQVLERLEPRAFLPVSLASRFFIEAV